MLTDPKFHLSQNHVWAPLPFDGIYLHQVGRLHCGRNMEVENHRHGNWFEITAVNEGCGEIFTNGIATTVRAGDLYLSFPEETHAIRSSATEPLKYDFFAFHTDLSPYEEDLTIIKDNYRAPQKRLFADDGIRRCMEDLTLAAAQEDKYQHILVASLMKEILIVLIRRFSVDNTTTTKNKKRVPTLREELCFQIMHYIDTHLYTMRDLTELSLLTGYNYSYLSSLFRTGTSQTLRSYYQAKRLERARQLLTEEKLSAVRIAELLGYTSPSAFGKAYKAHFGISPGKTSTDSL